MKQSQVKPGVRAMLSLGGRRGAVAVTVQRRALISDMDQRPHVWVCEDSRGRLHSATARQLQPMPAPTDASGKVIGWGESSYVVIEETHGGVVYQFRGV